MKIINLITKNVFDLPKEDANNLLKTSPELFARLSKSNKIIKPNVSSVCSNSVLSKILDE